MSSKLLILMCDSDESHDRMAGGGNALSPCVFVLLKQNIGAVKTVPKLIKSRRQIFF